MRPDQTVYEMIKQVLKRQAKEVVLECSGCSLQETHEAVIRTDAGRQLNELRDGPRAREEKARDWQENLLRERALERLEGMVTLEAVWRFAPEGSYSWVEGYLERLEGKEARAEYHARLEELASLNG